MSMINLKEFENNIQSQFGEDGVIEAIFNKIGTTNKICVEFGAWDGIHYSNTWNLWHNHQWEALLIEGDPEKYKVLVNNTASFDKVSPLLAFVADSGPHSLDVIFHKQGFPAAIDLLSIDIDGNDYYILKSLEQFHPRLIIIEYNPTIPPGITLIQQSGEYFGASASAILELAHEKDYHLVHMTDTNMFLLSGEALSVFGGEEPALAALFVSRHLVHVISSYDGKTMLVGNPPYAAFNTTRSKVKFPVISNPDDVTLVDVIIEKVK
jgi:hypothetical protein